MEKRVEDAISAMNPNIVFANPESAKHFLSAAKTDLVVVEVVKRVCQIIPWDKELARLAASRCNDGDYTDESEDNLADVELERIYKGCDNGTCKFHVPLGMLSSHIVTDAVRQWPEFMNKCYCAFVAACDDDSILLMEALKYCGHILESVELSLELIAWLNHMIHRIMTELQGIDTFQTLLVGIAVVESGAPLACLKGNDETSIALKRHIAGFHGVVLGKTKQAELKKDALRLLFCILTMPSEFSDEGYGPSEVLDYDAPYRGDDTFYCEWCCEELGKLSDKYNEDGDDDSDDEEENEQEDDESDD